jgi:hypothetical protein
VFFEAQSTFRSCLEMKMADAAVQNVIGGDFDRGDSTDTSQGRRVSRLLPVFIVLLLVLVVGWWYWPEMEAQDGLVPTGFAILLSAFLSLLPGLICIVQNITRRRQLDRLSTLEQFPVSQTVYFRVAKTTVGHERVGGINADFELPLFVYFSILLLGFLSILIGYRFNQFFKIPTVLLGGLKGEDSATYLMYQRQTFAILSTTFLAAYIYSLGRLLDRVNNNDLYPVSLYYYTIRIVIAVVVAAVTRHTADAFGIDSNSVLLLIAFGIGFAPDLFILAIIRRAFQALKIWGARNEPDEKTRPTSLLLLMIDDLSRDKIDRLNELGIDSAQVLARQNPFLLLPRLPFDLSLLVDWIGQAHLYALVKDDKLAQLRGLFIRDSFDLYLRLADDACRATVSQVLGMSDQDAQALRRQLDEDPSFARLNEVRVALVP